MKSLIKNRTVRLLFVGCLLFVLSLTSAKSQILVGADYGLEFAKLNGYSHTRSGGQISASYFLNANISVRLTIAAFNKELVGSNFEKVDFWTAISESLSANYYFSSSDFRPYIGLGVGQYNDKLSDENLEGYFNESRIFLSPEFGFLANVAPKVKVNAGFRYNYILDATDGSMTTFIGLKMPLLSQY